MELVKNKATGKPFIVLDDNGEAHFLLITPEGKVKRLERSLFDPIVVHSIKQKCNQSLTKIQMDTYSEYMDEFWPDN
ncbi:MAG: hypothetical protein ACOWYE_07575 [Desulfatiglandales bacterium]